MSTPSLLDSARKGAASELGQAPDKNDIDLEIIHIASDEKEEKDLEAKDPNFQEGGLRGWLIVLGSFLIQFCVFGYANAFGVYQDYYTRVYITNQSPSSVAFIGSVNGFLISSTGVYAGILYDRGYFYHLLYAGSFLCSFSLFMLSLAEPNHFYQNFLTQGIGLGLAGGMMYIPSVAVISIYFKKKQGLVMTFLATGSSLGALVVPIVLNNLFYSRLGFGGTMRVSAGFVTLMLLISCMLLRPKLPPPIKRSHMLDMIPKYYKDWPYIAMCIGYFFSTVGLYFPFFYLQLYAIKHGITKSLAFNAFVIMNGSILIGRLTPGFFAHSLGVVNMLIIASFCCTILLFSMAGLTNVPSFVVIVVLYGYSIGIFTTLQAPLISVLTTDVSELGTRLGVALMFIAMGILIGPPVLGSFLSSEFIWLKPAVVSGVFALVGTSLFATLPFLMKQK